MLVSAMSVLKRRSNRFTSDSQKFIPGALEIVNLGKLLHNWKEIVGIELYDKVWPDRCFRKNITVVVRDHQWLATFSFFKHLVLKKINEVLPALGTKKIIAKVGKIPDAIHFKFDNTPKNWPDWQNESDLKISNVSPELSEIMSRCRKKLNARLKGLISSGYFICSNCNSNIVTFDGDVCAVCQFRDHQHELYKLRIHLSDEPWILYDEIKSEHANLNVEEFESVKLLLLQDTLIYIEQLGGLLTDFYDEKINAEMRSEMVRALVLTTGKMPHKIHLNKLPEEDYLFDTWCKYLALYDEHLKKIQMRAKL